MKEMPARRSDEDCAHREDPQQAPRLRGSARIVIASTRAADGTYEDRTGPLLETWLRGRGLGPVDRLVVADGPEVGAAVREAIEAGADLVISSGGTGISPTDATPEQVVPLIDREMPGVLEAVRRRGAETAPTSLLSRGVAGMASDSFVVTLPGSRGGVRDGIAVLDPVLDHLLDQRDGGAHEADAGGGRSGADAGGGRSGADAGGGRSGADAGGGRSGADADPTRGAAPFAGEAEQLRIAEDPSMGSAASRVRLAEVRQGEISVTQLVGAVTDPRCGAIVTFDGVVRDHDGGRGVDRLEYSAHPGAAEVMDDVAREIAERYPDTLVAVAHRHGPLAIGDSALSCAVSAPHRKQAFVACDDLVDTVKQRLPIWKHQVFDDGETEWVGALG